MPDPNDRRPDIPKDVEEKLKRGRERLKEQAGTRNLALEFTRGNQYKFIGDDFRIYDQRGIVRSQLEPQEFRWRVWQTRNMILPIVLEKVASVTQRRPGYEILASTQDHEDVAAARLAEKICRAGHDLWGIRQAAKKVAYFAVVADEGFAMPYWDSSVGPYAEIMDENGQPINMGQGEVKVRVFSPNEVGHEPGVDFEDSKWFYIEHARPIEEVRRDPAYLGGELEADIQGGDTYYRSNKLPLHGAKHLVMVTEFFERPTPENPDGQHLTIANRKQIFAPQKYPMEDAEENVLDEPILHRLTYITDPDSDRGMGLVRHLIDPQRSLNDSINKTLEWKNLALVPQILAPKGSLHAPRITNAPGAVIEYDIIPGMHEPKWREVPAVPRELFEIADRAMSDMREIAESADFPAKYIESGKEAEALQASAAVSGESFIADVADWHSRVMRHCLLLVQRYYAEPRLMRYRGRTGWENIENFKGADIRKQADVSVAPQSIEPRSRAQIEQKVMNLAQMFPGYFPPEVLMSAMESGTAEQLIEDYEQDVSRANSMIQKIKRGPEFLFTMPPRPALPDEVMDPMTGEPLIDPETGLPITQVPGWMPRPFDGIPVHKAVFESWMKTDDYDNLDDTMKQAAMEYYRALLDIEARNAQREMMLQTQMAEEQGMANASKPQGAKPASSLPKLPQS